jgi:hypothetical protein
MPGHLCIYVGDESWGIILLDDWLLSPVWSLFKPIIIQIIGEKIH